MLPIALVFLKIPLTMCSIDVVKIVHYLMCIEYICVIDGFLIRYYVWACVLFPILFYIPKWFEAEYSLDLPKACYQLKEVSDCLVTVAGNVTAVQARHLNQLHGSITKLLSISCWNANATVTEQVCQRFFI